MVFLGHSDVPLTDDVESVARSSLSHDILAKLKEKKIFVDNFLELSMLFLWNTLSLLFRIVINIFYASTSQKKHLRREWGYRFS